MQAKHTYEQQILFLCQVDDFAVAAKHSHTAHHIIQQIDSNMTISMKALGLMTCFNGMDIIQTKHYIKLHCASYIWKVLATHDWFHDGKAT